MLQVARNPRVYLAGKIAAPDHENIPWRDGLKLIHNERRWGESCTRFTALDDEEALSPETVMTLGVGGTKNQIDFIGPFAIDLGHGGSYSVDEVSDFAKRDAIQRKLHTVNIGRIKSADFVFACIDEVDCFGTIAEIGVAFGAGVPVHLFFGERLKLKQRYDFWFVARCALCVYERITVQHAFERALTVHYAGIRGALTPVRIR